MIKSIYKFFKLIGLDFYILLLSIRGIPGYIYDIVKYRKNNTLKNVFPIKKYLPVLSDRYDAAGVARGHYFHQDLLVAQKVYQNNPLKHIDIGSRIDGFVAHIASFREIEVFDIRPLNISVTNMKFVQLDLIEPNKQFTDYCDSISCLHALEHFGLGRYGDPIDSEGHLKGFSNLHSILKPNGRLYFSVPIGEQRIEFNAHRIFSLNYLKEMFKNKFEIISFSFVDDSGNLYKDANILSDEANSNFNLKYGCGIFELKKIADFDIR